jgi:hypothetical protein
MKEIKKPLWLFFLSGQWLKWWAMLWAPRMYWAKSLAELVQYGRDLPYSEGQRRFGNPEPTAVIFLENLDVVASLDRNNDYQFFLSDASQDGQSWEATWPDGEQNGWLYRNHKRCRWVVVLFFIEKERLVIKLVTDHQPFGRQSGPKPPKGDPNPGFI